MPTPRHRQRALRRRQRTRRSLAAVVLGAALLLALRRDGDDPARTATTATTAAPRPSVAAATTAPTRAAVPTTTGAHRPATGWYAIVLSARKGGADREVLAAELAQHSAQGRVVDTDEVRTGDGRAPDYLPAPGLLVGAVGPFGSREQVEAWCASYEGDQGCQARQLVSSP